MKAPQLLVAGLLALNGPVLAQAPTTPPPVVTTTGEATIYANPDEVSFNIELRTQGADLSAARQANADLAAKAIGYLREQGVEERDIQTRFLNVSVEYRDYRERTDPRYVANQTIGVTLHDVDAFEDINAGLLELGVTGLSGPTFATSERKTLLLTARTEAVEDARLKAEIMAKALGQSIGSAYRIDDAEDRNTGFEYRGVSARSMAADAESSGPGIATGELEVVHRVTVSFYLRE